MKVAIPPFPTVPGLETILNALSHEIDHLGTKTISNIRANDSLLLQAPDGSVWEIKVGNTGTISAVKVSG